VGADGRHSTVARQVEAEEYLAYDAPRGMFWGYWDAPALWRTDPAYRFGMYLANTEGHIRVIFQTDHDQLLIGSLPPVEQARAWRTDPDAALITDLASDCLVGPLIAGAAPDGRIRGTVKERYFFRRAAGSGWALVGDAGHHKEFVIGDGITEALLQARSLASAIAQGTDAARHRWWRARDVEALPYFFLGQDEGALGPPTEVQQVVFSHAARMPALQARLAATMEHQLSPLETFSVRQVLWWTLGAAFRGSLGVVPQFLAMGKRGSAIKRELGLRRRLLAEAEASEPQSTPARN
jgi:2-polyprenyl-6-methoxyphenol hydroxylase-like FAD-dependent oxidoreductase